MQNLDVQISHKLFSNYKNEHAPGINALSTLLSINCKNDPLRQRFCVDCILSQASVLFWRSLLKLRVNLSLSHIC